MPSSLTNKKALRFVITLQTGTFGSSSANQITLEGYRAVVDIDKAGGMMMGTLRAQIYGVSQSDMNSATTLQWKPNQINKNTVLVYAIDGDQETLIFSGNIVNAWGNYQSMPDVFLQIQAQAAYFNQLSLAQPTSFEGKVDVVTMMGQIAGKMGYTFENNGVSVPPLINPYLPNTLMEQAKALAIAANIDLYLDDTVLAITPRNNPRNSLIPDIGPGSGLNGYPTFDGTGVTFTTLFNPAVKFGGLVKLTTSITQAAGEWIVTSVSHRLESEKPGGAWFSTVRGNHIGYAVTN